MRSFSRWCCRSAARSASCGGSIAWPRRSTPAKSRSPDPRRQEAGTVADLRALLDTLHAHDVLAIARIVVFKDSVAARMHPTETIRRADGSPWRVRQGLTWVDPYSATIRAYILRVAGELVARGFDEIHWDDSRVPEPCASLPAQHVPQAAGVPTPDALAAFLRKARTRLHARGVRGTADIFGLVTTAPGPLDIAQRWERLAPVTDVLLPMVDPSHYPHGSFGLARPTVDPCTVVHRTMTHAMQRDAALGIRGARIRPCLQACSLGQPPYGAAELRAQCRATHDAGIEGWVLWHPGSTHEPFVPALARTRAPRGQRTRTVATP